MEVSPHTRLAGERLQPTRPSLRKNTAKIIIFQVTYQPCQQLSRSQKERNKQALADFCSICSVWHWPAEAADTYGEILAFLEQKGRITGANDLLIAAHTMYLNAVLITNNTREFETIPDLKIED